MWRRSHRQAQKVRGWRNGKGFTLIELLVVIAIIARKPDKPHVSAI